MACVQYYWLNYTHASVTDLYLHLSQFQKLQSIEHIFIRSQYINELHDWYTTMYV